MTSSFSADPQALTTASKAFSAQVDPINTLATRAEEIKGGPSNAGRAYHAQGVDYRSAMLTFIETQLTPMASKTVWVADTLASTAQHYGAQDAAASTGLQSAGQGA